MFRADFTPNELVRRYLRQHEGSTEKLSPIWRQRFESILLDASLHQVSQETSATGVLRTEIRFRILGPLALISKQFKLFFEEDLKDSGWMDFETIRCPHSGPLTYVQVSFVSLHPTQAMPPRPE